MSSIIDVDATGADKDGNRYDEYAYPDKVAAGLAINRPVLLRYPDGRLAEGNEARITPKGLTVLAQQMKVRSN